MEWRNELQEVVAILEYCCYIVRVLVIHVGLACFSLAGSGQVFAPWLTARSCMIVLAIFF